MSPLFPAKSGRWAANSLLGETGNSLSQIRENSGPIREACRGFSELAANGPSPVRRPRRRPSQTRETAPRGSDVVIVRPGEIKGEQRGRMASTLAQRLNDQGVTAGPHQPVARVGFLVGGQAGLVDRRQKFR